LSPQKQLNIAGVVHDTIGICYRRLAARKCVAIGATFGHGSEPLAPPVPLDSTHYPVPVPPAPPTLELRDRSPFAIRSTLPPIPGDYFGLGHRNPRKTGIRDSATPRQASQSVRAPNGAMEHWNIGAADLPFD